MMRPGNWLLTRIKLWVDGPHWVTRSTVALLLISLLFHFPNINDTIDLISGAPYTPNWENLMAQRDSLLTAQQHDTESHLSKTTFRLTVPALAKAFRLDPLGVFMLQFFLGIAMIVMMLRLSFRIAGDKVHALLFTAGIVFTFAGSASFFDTWAHRDPYAFFFLLVALITGRWYVVLPVVLLAAFTDERGLIASSFVVCFHYWLRPTEEGSRARLPAAVWACAGAWSIYFVLRYWLTTNHGFPTATGRVGPATFVDQIEYAPWGLWSGLEGNWIILLIGLVVMWRSARLRAFFPFLTLLFVVMLVSVSVRDVTRSMAYGYVALFPALLYLKRNVEHMELRVLLLYATVISVIHPMYYTFGDGKLGTVEPLVVKVFRTLMG